MIAVETCGLVVLAIIAFEVALGYGLARWNATVGGLTKKENPPTL
jgi:hypothetical protein